MTTELTDAGDRAVATAVLLTERLYTELSKSEMSRINLGPSREDLALMAATLASGIIAGDLAGPGYQMMHNPVSKTR